MGLEPADVTVTGGAIRAIETDLPHSLRGSPACGPLLFAMGAALQAVDPVLVIRSNLHFDGEILSIAGVEHDLTRRRRLRVVGAGKASGHMAAAVWRALGGRIEGGMVIVKEGGDLSLETGTIDIVPARHPVPDGRGVVGAREILRLTAELDEGDLLLTLISGGASALLTVPAEGISLTDLQTTTDLLITCGADIREVNRVRKHLSLITGGRLARSAWPARVETLILSDVVGDSLDAIGSGPTAPDPSSYEDGLRVLQTYHLKDRVPAGVLRLLEEGRRGAVAETPKPGDPCFDTVRNVVIGSNRVAAEAAVGALLSEGVDARLVTVERTGEAREVGREAASLAQGLLQDPASRAKPICLVIGGETTVTVKGRGKGGRNQEVALAAAEGIDGCPGVTVVSFATDGQDGPTDAAGAVADGNTLKRGRGLGMNVSGYLASNDAYRYFSPLGDLLRCGPTGTNVADLIFVYVAPRSEDAL